jgi:hypothetical protein
VDAGRDRTGITGGGEEKWKITRKKNYEITINPLLLAHAGGALYGTGSWPPLVREVRGRPFGARGRSSVRYGPRLGDLTESWFILFSN